MESAAGGIPEPASLRPPSALTSRLSPSSFPPPSVPGGRARSSPSPEAFCPAPRGLLPFPPRPPAPTGASDTGAAWGSEAPSPGGAGLSQLPAEAAVLPQRRKLASPYCGAGRAGWCQQGCVFTALRWPLRYTFESLTGRLSVNTGCAPEPLSRGGVCSFWSIEPGKRTG